MKTTSSRSLLRLILLAAHTFRFRLRGCVAGAWWFLFLASYDASSETFWLCNNSPYTVQFSRSIYSGLVNPDCPLAGDPTHVCDGQCGPCWGPGSLAPGDRYPRTVTVWPGMFFRFVTWDKEYLLPSLEPTPDGTYFDLFTGVSDPNDHGVLPGTPQPGPDCGMPGWRVSEPYLNLWIEDEPLGYQPALGPRVAFALSHKQREITSGLDKTLFSVGKQWSFSWSSFVSLDATNAVVQLPVGGTITFTNGTDYLTNTQLTGSTNAGFTLSYADGSKEVYGLVVTNATGAFLKAFMTERWNPINQRTRLDYESYTPGAAPVIRLKYVVDGDLRTNTIFYVTNVSAFSTNLISRVVDAFGRTNSLAYDSLGRLTNLTDVAGLSTALQYDFRNWVTNLVTPYGPTTFSYNEVTTDIPNGRAIQITEPDGRAHLYLYRNSAPGIPGSFSAGEVPSTSPLTNTFDNADLHLRNTFHWAPQQFAQLSTNFTGTGDVSQLTTNDFLLARWQHWLAEPDYYVTNACSETLSLERAPSPDGSTAGQLTWYDYAGKTNTGFIGTQMRPLYVGRVLPDGSSWFERTDRNTLGYVTTNVGTYASGGSVALRTNLLAYGTNLIDLVAATNVLGVQVSSNAFNAYHQVLTNFNALNERTVFTYNTNQQLTSIQRPNGAVTTNLYFTSGTYTNWLDRTIDFEINGAATTFYRTNAFTYTNGLVFTLTDARGLTLTNIWDALQRLRRVDFPDGTFVTNTFDKLDLVRVIDRLGYTNSLGYDASRRLIAATNAFSTVTRFGYCDCGSPEYVTNAFGSSLQQVTHFVHDLQGNRIAAFFPDGTSVTNRYDAWGRLTNTVDSFGTSVTNWFNNHGLLTVSSNAFGQVFLASFDALDRATNAVDANGVTVTNTFDLLSRPLTRGHPDNGVERWGYTPNVPGVTSYTNQLGTNVVLYAYDALGRKTNEVYPGLMTNRFAYGPSGDLLALTDGKGQVTSWGYDAQGRTTSKTNAAGTEVFRYQYDAGSRLTNRWSAAKGDTAYAYDALGNLTTINYPVSPDIILAYDALGRLTNLVDGVGTTAYGYTATGQILNEDGPWDQDTVAYSYNNGLRSGLTLVQPNASDWAQTYAYDAIKRLTNVTSPAGAFGYEYPVGTGSTPSLISRLSLPNGSYITNTFDAVARLLSTQLRNSGGAVLNSHAYGYNLANQRTNQARVDGGGVDYTYDNLGQLKTALGKESGGAVRYNEQFGYAYDPAQNLNQRTNNALVQAFGVDNLNQLTTGTRSGTLTVAGTTTSAATNVTVNGSTANRYADNTFALGGFSLADGTNTFTAVAADSLGRRDTNTVSVNLPATVSFTYDANGNLTGDGRRVFAYDDEDQLISVIVTNAAGSSTKSEFAYDGKFRRRIRKEFVWSGSWVQTAEVRYIYDGNQVIQERDGGNLPTLTLTRTGLRLLARTDAASGTHAFFHADGNGNVVVLVNGQQTIVARYTYDPFGNTLSLSGPLATINLYRFSGKEWHSASGLFYFGRRFYDPNLQRWVNRDPIAEAGGLNLYAHCGNAPTSLIDELGLDPVSYSFSKEFIYPGKTMSGAQEALVQAAINSIAGAGDVWLAHGLNEKLVQGQILLFSDPFGNHTPSGVVDPFFPDYIHLDPALLAAVYENPSYGAGIPGLANVLAHEFAHTVQLGTVPDAAVTYIASLPGVVIDVLTGKEGNGSAVWAEKQAYAYGDLIGEHVSAWIHHMELVYQGEYELLPADFVGPLAPWQKVCP